MPIVAAAVLMAAVAGGLALTNVTMRNRASFLELPTNSCDGSVGSIVD